MESINLADIEEEIDTFTLFERNLKIKLDVIGYINSLKRFDHITYEELYKKDT